MGSGNFQIHIIEYGELKEGDGGELNCLVDGGRHVEPLANRRGGGGDGAILLQTIQPHELRVQRHRVGGPCAEDDADLLVRRAAVCAAVNILDGPAPVRLLGCSGNKCGAVIGPAVRETLGDVVVIHLGKDFFDGGFRGGFAHVELVVPRGHGGTGGDPIHHAGKDNQTDSQKHHDDHQCVTPAVPPYGPG